MNVSAADKRGTVVNTTRRQREVDVRDDEVRVRLQKGRGRDEEAHILAAAPSPLLSSPLQITLLPYGVLAAALSIAVPELNV